MRDDLCHIVFVLDRSGSMTYVRDDAIKGFNDFVEDQKQVTGEAKLTLLQFNDEWEYTHRNKDINEVPNLNEQTYDPHGYTALLDAIGTAIDREGEILANMPESERPFRVVVAILTDGLENSSTHYSLNQVKEKIKEQQYVYSWEFLFLGAHFDAIKMAEDIGIKTQNINLYEATREGTQVAFNTSSQFVTQARTGKAEWR